jgi:eukaryotic-like serine/threonine-protein kinase
MSNLKSFPSGLTPNAHLTLGGAHTSGVEEVFDAVVSTGGKERRVAAKRLSPFVVSSPALVDALYRELKWVTASPHPHLVGILGAVHLGGELYLLLDDVGSVSLERLLVSGAMPGPEVVGSIAQDILDGLGYAHRGGAAGDGQVLHRAICPKNIWITPSGQARLLDLGLARALDETRINDRREFVDALPYHAPEQLNGGQLGPATDIFSFGVVLWEALTGRALFRRPSVSETIRAITEGRVPDVGEGVLAVVKHCLAQRAPDRYQTAADLAAALRGAMPVASRSAAAACVSANLASRDLKRGPTRPTMTEAGLRDSGVDRKGSGQTGIDRRPTGQVPGIDDFIVESGAERTVNAQPATRRSREESPVEAEADDIPLVTVPPDADESEYVHPDAVAAGEPGVRHGVDAEGTEELLKEQSGDYPAAGKEVAPAKPPESSTKTSGANASAAGDMASDVGAGGGGVTPVPAAPARLRPGRPDKLPPRARVQTPGPSPRVRRPPPPPPPGATGSSTGHEAPPSLELAEIPSSEDSSVSSPGTARHGRRPPPPAPASKALASSTRLPPPTGGVMTSSSPMTSGGPMTPVPDSSSQVVTARPPPPPPTMARPADATSPEMPISRGVGTTPNPFRQTGSGAREGSGRSTPNGTPVTAPRQANAGQYMAYDQSSVLVRLLAPFIQDPRPPWLLALYFALGLALGLFVAYAKAQRWLV